MDDTATKRKKSSLSNTRFGGPGRGQVWGGVRVEWLLVAGLAALTVSWAISNLMVGHTGLVVLS